MQSRVAEKLCEDIVKQTEELVKLKAKCEVQDEVINELIKHTEAIRIAHITGQPTPRLTDILSKLSVTPPAAPPASSS